MLTDEFIQEVQSNIRPEGRDAARWEEFWTDDQIPSFLLALQRISSAVERQLVMAGDTSEDPEKDEWRRKATAFKMHVQDYIREAKAVIRQRRLDVDTQDRVRELTRAIARHRDAIASLDDDVDTSAIDEALWGVLDAA